MAGEPPPCQTCGATDDVRVLSELGFGPGHETDVIRLCAPCIRKRQAAAWDRDDPDGQGILKALDDRQERPKERYTFVKDSDEGVHLLRLRSDWVDAHAESSSSGSD